MITFGSREFIIFIIILVIKNTLGKIDRYIENFQLWSNQDISS